MMFSSLFKYVISFFVPATVAYKMAAPAIYPQQQQASAVAISNDVNILARTIWGEARGQGKTGMQAVANVIINRRKYVLKNPLYIIRWGNSIAGICQKSYQFSVWNKNDPNLPLIKNVTSTNPEFRVALDIASRAVAGTLPDITGGSTYYHTANIKPQWSTGAEPRVKIGSHVFYTPNQIA